MMQRARLLTTLDQALASGRQFTLVSAPPGFGKTTLIAMWTADRLARRGDPVVWVSLDESDNDPVQCFRYLVSAFQTVDPAIGQVTAHLLESPQIPSAAMLIAPLISDVQNLGRPVTLVLDDYHVITDGRVHDAVRFLVERLPTTLDCVIITREDPPLPLARMRVRSLMTEIRERDLRFTDEETAIFLREVMRLDLDTGSVQALVNRTEGWVAALQLVSLSLQEDRANAPAIIAEFAGDHRYVMDYLLTEVLERQPTPVRDFLRQTSILHRFNATLCDAVTGRADSRALLDQLETANLFPLDHRRSWYRYHQLFADMLVHTLSNAERAALCQRAAAWFAEHEADTTLSTDAAASAEAIHYAFEAAALTGSYAQVIPFIRRHFDAYAGDGRLVTVLSWLDALPEAELAAHLDLAVNQAWTLVLSEQFGRAEPALAAIELLLNRLSIPERGRLHLAQAILALGRSDFSDTLQHAQQAAQDLAADHPQWRLMALWTLAEAQERSEPLPQAIASLREAARLSHSAGKALFANIVESSLAHALWLNGQPDEADAVCQAAIAVYRKQKHISPAYGLVLCTLARMAIDANALDAAHDYLRQARSLDSVLDVASIGAVMDGVEAQLLAIDGNFDAALVVVRQALERSAQTKLADMTWLHALEGDLLLRRGDVEQAEAWAADAGLTPDQPLLYLHLEQHLVYARLLIAQGDGPVAAGFVQRLEAFAAERGYWRYWIVARLLRVGVARQALAGRYLSVNESLTDLLADAVALAARERCVRVFLDDAPQVIPMLPQVRQAAPVFVDAVLDAQRLGTASALESGESLSDREHEVLRLIAHGLSNAEIAERLVLTVGTVKQHINHLYSKLAVRSRTQAIVEARIRHLID
ncbi:MAG: hypothetical protein IPK19_39430 [Chloroflexi bacterium]|nr:hypothetical protein [Chloroflexota bacterium]